MPITRTIVMLVLSVCSTACTYTLRGRVIEGDTSYVAVVDKSDPRLNENGIEGVRLHVQLDPGKLNRKTVCREVSSMDGAFALPVDEIGAGVLEYDVGVFARRAGYSPAEGSFRLPPSGKRIIIVLMRGRDYDQGESLEDEWSDLRMFEQ